MTSLILYLIAGAMLIISALMPGTPNDRQRLGYAAAGIFIVGFAFQSQGI
jgi:hypothetical protein